jgi:predicted TIM-barrel fold metal-dependent hydrolase
MTVTDTHVVAENGVPEVKIDADMHLLETRDLWQRYTKADQHDLALRLADDDLGHTWLMQGDRRIHLAELPLPGDVERVGAYRERVRQGLPAAESYDAMCKPEYWDPAARVRQLDDFGLNGAVLFPNYGLLWERPLSGDLESLKVNMSAWNRWSVDVAAEGRGRLFPVGHVTLRDQGWLESELATLAAGGVRLAMVAPALVDGKRLSHPDLDRIWSMFVDQGVTPVFHVADFDRPFADAWYEGDFDPDNPVLSSAFLSVPAALALADLAIHGVLERHPALRLGVVELTATWVPLFLMLLDNAFDFHAKTNGRPLTRLSRKPSESVRQAVRVAALAYEYPGRLIEQAGEDLFMFGSDYPHPEGIVRPVEDYSALAGPLGGSAATQLYSGNLSWLLSGSTSLSI